MSALDRVFDAATLAEYRAYLAVTPPAPHASHVRWLSEILTAHGPAPSDPEAARMLKKYRARRAAFETYVEAADACGVLDTNLTQRLRSVVDDSFRAALSECLACWLFAGMLGYPVSPRPSGRTRKELEFTVTAPEDTFAVEVKAPAVDPPGRSWAGDDSRVIEAALKDAASQFARGTKNVLVIAPSLRTSVWSHRGQLVKALIGEPVMHVFIDVDGRGESRTEPGFAPRGRLVRPGKKGPDGAWLPAHTRVSAVMTIEVFEAERAEVMPAPAESPERILGEWVRRRYSPDNEFWPEHRVLVVHNPFADMPLSEETFARFPQLVPRGEEMHWTDTPDGGANDE